MGTGAKAKDIKKGLWTDYIKNYGPPPPVPPSDYALQRLWKGAKAFSSHVEPLAGDAPPLAGSWEAIVAAAQINYTRRLVEFCCEENSVLGQPDIAEDCEVIRLTIENDLRTKEGLEMALKAVDTDLPCLLWASIPCDGGSPIHYLSKDWDTDDFQEKLNKKRETENGVVAAQSKGLLTTNIGDGIQFRSS